MYYDEHDFLRLGYDDSTRDFYEANKVLLRKMSSRLMKDAKQRAKRQTCFMCGKECSSFCNSHSVPQVFLKRIAPNGKVYFSGMQIELPILGADTGVKEAGTFRLICRECDSTLFQDYEDPSAYNQLPTGKMLCEIAMKNYLLMISKRLLEKELYQLLYQSFPEQSFFEEQITISDLDLRGYIADFQYAKQSFEKNKDDAYYLFYYQKLDYVVPLAMQSSVVVVCDFKDNLIVNVKNLSPDYDAKSIHVAVFPLESTSVVLMFCRSNEKTYRRFYRQLNKLNKADQLAAINHIIHSYCENIFLSKDIPESILKSPEFQDVCQKCTTSKKNLPDSIASAIKEFSLSKFRETPNLLDNQYAINP